MIWVKIGSLLMFLAVALGAFGSHGLRDRLSAYSMEVYRTAVLYHALHALGLCVVGWLSSQTQDPRLWWAATLLTAGIVLFSGSLYALSLSGLKWLGAITPLGGICFLAGWLLVFLCVKS